MVAGDGLRVEPEEARRVVVEEVPLLREVTMGHWGFGRIENLLFPAGGKAPNGEWVRQAVILVKLLDSLSGYPLLDEEDHSAREYEGICEAWADNFCRQAFMESEGLTRSAMAEILLGAEADPAEIREWLEDDMEDPDSTSSYGLPDSLKIPESAYEFCRDWANG